ncbi:MAG: UDP-glucose 4-epimerase [Euryarchaeota archaeon]|nr:UDP-glucose 4-epimerase [Euryarchaeota archaeon]
MVINKKLLYNKVTDAKILNIDGENRISLNDLIRNFRSIAGSTSESINIVNKKEIPKIRLQMLVWEINRSDTNYYSISAKV